MNFKLNVAVLSTLLLATPVLAQQHTWVQPYFGLQDSPFHGFGLPDTLLLEDFEDGELTTPGLTLLSGSGVQEGRISITSTSTLSMVNSVTEDTGDPTTGLFLLGVPLGCATTFPLLCPATVTLEFDTEQGLPTFVGFVWTDAVLSTNPRSGLPFGTVNAFVGQAAEPVQVARVFNLPAADPDDVTADDLFIGIVDERGIKRLEFKVVTDQDGGFLSMDHVQFGFSATPGDANRDGRVEFSDFLTLAEHFGNDGDWSQGDFNFNGTVEFLDFLNLALHFGETNAVNVSPVPEPTAISLAAIACVSLFLRRRQR